MKSGRKRFWLRLGVLILLAAVAVIGWLESRKPRWHSSATAPRDPDKTIETRLTGFSKIAPGYRESCQFDEPVEGVFNLGSGQKIRVAAISLSVPGQAAGPWRDPATLEKIAVRQLPVPDELLEIAEPEQTPALNLLFHAEGPDGFSARAEFFQVFDERTGARIGFRNQTRKFRPTIGDWTLVRIDLNIWHDTPIGIQIDWLRGEPSVNTLNETSPGIWGIRSGEVGIEVFPSWFATLQTAEVSETHQFALIFEPPDGLAWTEWFEHPPFRVAGMTGTTQVGRWPSTSQNLRFEGTPKSVRLAQLPDSKSVWLPIPGLPDMPNGRGLENLFDARIPFAKTREPILLAARAAELTIAGDPIPLSVPEFQEYRDTTVGEILRIQAETPPFRRIEIREDANALHISQGEAPLLHKLKSWWKAKAPRWLGGMD